MTSLSIFLAAVFLGIESFFHNRALEPMSAYNIAYNSFSSFCDTVVVIVFPCLNVNGEVLALKKNNKTKQNQSSHLWIHHQGGGHHDFLVDSLVQVASEKSPLIRARAAVFQKWEDHRMKVCIKKAKWGDCPRTSLYSTTKECQKNLVIRLTDLF